MRTLGKTKVTYQTESNGPPRVQGTVKEAIGHSRDRNVSEKAESILSSIISRTQLESRTSSRASNLENEEIDKEALKLRAKTQELISAASKLKDSIKNLNYERPASPGTQSETKVEIERITETSRSPRIHANASAVFGNGKRSELDIQWQERQKQTKREREQVQQFLQEIDFLRKELADIQQQQAEQGKRNNAADGDLRRENRKLHKILDEKQHAVEKAQQALKTLRLKYDQVVASEREQAQKLKKRDQNAHTSWAAEFRDALVDFLETKSVLKLSVLQSKLRSSEAALEPNAQPFGSAAIGLVSKLSKNIQKASRTMEQLPLKNSDSAQDELQRDVFSVLAAFQESLSNLAEHVFATLNELGNVDKRREKSGNLTELQVLKLETLLDEERQRNHQLERRLEHLLLDLQEHQQAKRSLSRNKNDLGPQEALLDQIDTLILSNKDWQKRQLLLSQQVTSLQRENDNLRNMLQSTQFNADTVKKIAEQTDEQARVDLQLEKQKLVRKIESLEDRLEDEKLQLTKRDQVIKVLKTENKNLQLQLASIEAHERNPHTSAGRNIDSTIEALFKSPRADDDAQSELDDSELYREAQKDRDLAKMLNSASEKLSQQKHKCDQLQEKLADTETAAQHKQELLEQANKKVELFKEYLDSYEVQFAKITSVEGLPSSIPSDILNIIKEHGGDVALTELLTVAVSNTNDYGKRSPKRSTASAENGEASHPFSFAQHFLRLHALYQSTTHTLTRLQHKHAEAAKALQSQRIQIDALASDNESTIAKLIRVEEQAASEQKHLRNQLENIKREHASQVVHFKSEITSQQGDISQLKQLNNELAKKIKQIIVGYQQTFSD